MKYVFSIFLVSLLFCFACKKKENSANPVPTSGNCLPISRGESNSNYNLQISYDNEGWPIKGSTYLGKMDYEIDSFFYDSKGLLTKSQYSRLSERYLTYYEYDSLKRLTKIIMPEKGHSYITEFVYNSDNKPGKIIGYYKDSLSTNMAGTDEIKYDNRGNVSSILHFDNMNILLDSIVSKYDSKNGIYSSIKLNYAGYRLDYDTWGPNNITQKQLYYVKTPKDNQTTLYSYNYNSNGFPIAVSQTDASIMKWQSYSVMYNCK